MRLFIGQRLNMKALPLCQLDMGPIMKNSRATVQV